MTHGPSSTKRKNLAANAREAGGNYMLGKKTYDNARGSWKMLKTQPPTVEGGIQRIQVGGGGGNQKPGATPQTKKTQRARKESKRPFGNRRRGKEAEGQSRVRTRGVWEWNGAEKGALDTGQKAKKGKGAVGW